MKNATKRLARRAFDKMLQYEYLCPGYKRNKVGALLDKLTPAERENLQKLKAEDVYDERLMKS